MDYKYLKYKSKYLKMKGGMDTSTQDSSSSVSSLLTELKESYEMSKTLNIIDELTKFNPISIHELDYTIENVDQLKQLLQNFTCYIGTNYIWEVNDDNSLDVLDVLILDEVSNGFILFNNREDFLYTTKKKGKLKTYDLAKIKVIDNDNIYKQISKLIDNKIVIGNSVYFAKQFKTDLSIIRSNIPFILIYNYTSFLEYLKKYYETIKNKEVATLKDLNFLLSLHDQDIETIKSELQKYITQDKFKEFMTDFIQSKSIKPMSSYKKQILLLIQIYSAGTSSDFSHMFNIEINLGIYLNRYLINDIEKFKFSPGNTEALPLFFQIFEKFKQNPTVLEATHIENLNYNTFIDKVSVLLHIFLLQS